MEESRQFATSHLSSPLTARIDSAREKMEEAKRRMEDYCRILPEDVVMDRTRVIRERYQWYQNFVDSCYGHGRRSMEMEPTYLGDGYEGEISRLNRGARIVTRGMELLNTQFYEQQRERRRIALERDLDSSIRNPLRQTDEPDPNPDYIPPVLRRIATPSTSNAASSSSSVASTSNREDDGFSRLAPAQEVSFRILRDFVHEDVVDEGLDGALRSPVRQNQHIPPPPPAIDFPDLDDDLESIGHGSIPENADSSDDNVSDNGGDDDNGPPVVPVVAPVIVPVAVAAAAPVVAAPAVALAAAPVIAAAPAVAAPAPLAPVPVRRRKRVWNVGIAAKNEPPRKKVLAEGEEADFGSVDSLEEEAEALSKMLLELDLENLHLEVNTKLTRVRGSLKRWGRRMSNALFKKNINAINFCRIAMGVKD